jgi:hypothetical protein
MQQLDHSSSSTSDERRSSRTLGLRDHNPKLSAIDNPVVVSVELGFEGEGCRLRGHAWSQLDGGGAEKLVDVGHCLRVYIPALLSPII